jgi:hypothetical protein
MLQSEQKSIQRFGVFQKGNQLNYTQWLFHTEKRNHLRSKIMFRIFASTSLVTCHNQ